MATGASGLVQFCKVLAGNPAHSTLVGESLHAVAAPVGRVPKQAAFDGGFASIAHVALAEAKGVIDVCFS